MFKYLIGFLLVPCFSTAQGNQVLDTILTGYTYPYPTATYYFRTQQQDLQMTYMDVKPVQPNGKTVVLLHGKNFNGAYWRTTMAALLKNGYRVIVPDQLGFGKSSKPANYQFSLQQLALNTKNLLDFLDVPRIQLLGHSMGGMLATRFTLMFPGRVEKLILENPIGLEDWKLVVPYIPIDSAYKTELNQSFEAVKKYQTENYYDGQWKEEYNEWAWLLSAWVKHPQYSTVAWNNALTSDMVFTQPVLYEFHQVRCPTLLIIGTRDRTAIGKSSVPENVRKVMGQYQVLGKQTQKKIRGAQLMELENVGHLPHIESFKRFIEPLLGFLKK